MKVIDKILLALLLASFALPLTAQIGREEIEIEDIKFSVVEDSLDISFAVTTGAKATKNAYTLILTPLIESGEFEHYLPAIKVEGKRAQKVRLREIKRQKDSYRSSDDYYTSNNQILRYNAVVPLDEQMREARFLLRAVSEGCCSSAGLGSTVIAERVLYEEIVPEQEIVMRSEVVKDTLGSTGDRLSVLYPYVLPATKIDIESEMPTRNQILESIQRANRASEESISVYFKVGNSNVDMNYMGNREAFVELISVIRTIAQSKDSRVVGVVISGFASPEGSTALNTRLAQERANAAKAVLLHYSNLSNNSILTYNGGIDWEGLKEMVVHSNLSYRDVVADVIDSAPAWEPQKQGERVAKLMLLDSGRVYRTLLQDYFPRLRQAAYVKVYYTDL